MKLCRVCSTEKELEYFGKNKSKKDGLQSSCKECSSRISKKYYSENQEKHKLLITRRKKENIHFARQQMIKFLDGKSCIDCGCNNLLVLEFDHIRDKKDCISQMIASSCSWKTIKEEINKCEIRCRNCHGIKTHEEKNTYKWQYLKSKTP